MRKFDDPSRVIVRFEASPNSGFCVSKFPEMTTEETSTIQDQNPPADPVPVQQRVRGRVPVWILPTLATFSFCIITAVVLSSIVLGFQLHANERSVSRNKNQVARVTRAVQPLNATVKSFKARLSSVAKSLARRAKAQAEFLELLATVKCAVDQYLQNSTEVEGCCPPGWETFHGSCYFVSPKPLSWTDSRDWCQDQRSHLFILSTDHDWEFINHYAPYQWVGLSDKSGEWLWVDGTSYTREPRRWHRGQPDNWHGKEDCAHLYRGRLNDVHCAKKLHFICKKKI